MNVEWAGAEIRWGEGKKRGEEGEEEGMGWMEQYKPVRGVKCSIR